MFKLKETAVPERLANKKFGGSTARFSPALAPAGAMRVARHNSKAFATPPELSTQISSVAEVVVRDMAYTFIRLVGVKVITPFVAVSEPVEPVRVLPTMAMVETEFVTVPAVEDKETVPEIVTVPRVAVAIFTLKPATALLTVTSVEVRATLTGLPTALVMVEAVVEGVTVPVIVTVPSVAVAIFTLPLI